MEHRFITRTKILVLAGIAILTAACTPIQLQQFSEVTGVTFDAQTEQDLLALPDAPMRVNNGMIHPDGTYEQYVAPAGSKCPQWYDEAMSAGWTHTDWSKLDRVIWRESRCDNTVYNGRGRDNSYGLMQLNMLAHRGWVGPLVGWDFNRLYDPVTNFTIARELYNKARSAYGCGWQPWRMCR